MMGALQPLRDALTLGNAEAILQALPEPPHFLSELFTLHPDDRDTIISSIIPVLAEEDQWEVIEAAFADSVVRPERTSFLSIIPFIPAELIADSYHLASQFSDPVVVQAMHQVFDARADELGLTDLALRPRYV